jgi:hypothetical protein
MSQKMPRPNPLMPLQVGKEYIIIPSFVGRKSINGIFHSQLTDNREIMEMIVDLCNQTNTDVVPVDKENVKFGSLFMAKYGDKPKFYRAMVVEPIDKDDEESKAVVDFYDYGNTETVSLKDAAQMPDLADIFVQQSFVCKWKDQTKKAWKQLLIAHFEEYDIKIKILKCKFDKVAETSVYTIEIMDIEKQVKEAAAADKEAVPPLDVVDGAEVTAAVQPILEPAVAPKAEMEKAIAVEAVNPGPVTREPVPAGPSSNKKLLSAVPPETRRPVAAIASTSTLDQEKIEVQPTPTTGPVVPPITTQASMATLEVEIQTTPTAPVVPTNGDSQVGVEGHGIQNVAAAAASGTIAASEQQHGQASGYQANGNAAMFQQISNLLNNDPEFVDTISRGIAGLGYIFGRLAN